MVLTPDATKNAPSPKGGGACIITSVRWRVAVGLLVLLAGWGCSLGASQPEPALIDACDDWRALQQLGDHADDETVTATLGDIAGSGSTIADDAAAMLEALELGSTEAAQRAGGRIDRVC